MTHQSTDNLVPTETDMLIHMFGNTEKLVDSANRWRYADHKNDNDRDSEEDKLDVDADDFIRESRKPKEDAQSVFKRPDEDRQLSDRDTKNERSKTESKRVESTIKSDAEYTETARDTTTEADTRNLSKKELMLLKLDMLRKLGELKQCGVHLSQNYNLDSDLDMMQYEYKLHHDIRTKQNTVQWMSHMMIGIIKGTEMFNDTYNPFDIKLEGLSDKIGSDMHNFYTVLGDIYEKYNQPGKQMAPEMKLLLMISGAALSIQVNRVVPGFGSSANTIKNEENLRELRQKAEADSSDNAANKQDYFKTQHNAAAQKAADIKMLKEKELEFQKMNKLMDEKNTNMKQFKENLILSSESQSRDHRKKGKKQESESEDDDPTQRMTQAEIERVRKMRYIEEQKHLEAMRKMAHQKSELFRANTTLNGDQSDRRMKDLERQNKQIDNILESIDRDDKGKQPKCSTTKLNTLRSSTRDKDSVSSTSSTVSINKNIDMIMNKTKHKLARDIDERVSEKFDTDTPDVVDDLEEQIAKKQKKMTKNKVDTKDRTDVSKNSTKSVFKIDNTIEKLLEDDDSEYDQLSADDISFGSNSKNKKQVDDKKKSNQYDFGTISIGSKKNNKGERVVLNIGKK